MITPIDRTSCSSRSAHSLAKNGFDVFDIPIIPIYGPPPIGIEAAAPSPSTERLRAMRTAQEAPLDDLVFTVTSKRGGTVDNLDGRTVAALISRKLA